MKKTIISLAAFALLTSAVPALAQQIQQAPALTTSTKAQNSVTPPTLSYITSQIN
ncbi:hypothetical protein NQ117_18145 [Paenibacillus sp. SC116]|uniref:hypothetical protein n=1 Tax=Paenibacillus sp. SC116 TaxID=2968986 RepID=UPI00215B3C0F|nr:hypothetical protein [Paenibacillus sp. SC116]MCR8845608.1 hypothetical protein [Paenibacillus sp. SC116]